MKTLRVIVGFSGKKKGQTFEANDKLASFLLTTGHVEIVENDAPEVIKPEPIIVTTEMPVEQIVRRRGRPSGTMTRNITSQSDV